MELLQMQQLLLKHLLSKSQAHVDLYDTTPFWPGAKLSHELKPLLHVSFQEQATGNAYLCCVTPL